MACYRDGFTFFLFNLNICISNSDHTSSSHILCMRSELNTVLNTLIWDILFTVIDRKCVVNRNVINFLKRCSSRSEFQLQFSFLSRQLNIYIFRPLEKHDLQLPACLLPTFGYISHELLYIAVFAFACSTTSMLHPWAMLIPLRSLSPIPQHHHFICIAKCWSLLLLMLPISLILMFLVSLNKILWSRTSDKKFRCLSPVFILCLFHRYHSVLTLKAELTKSYGIPKSFKAITYKLLIMSPFIKHISQPYRPPRPVTGIALALSTESNTILQIQFILL
jgi:hypothetical protein